MNPPYAVALCGVDGLPPAERITAELRFVRELEKSLGGSEAVVRVYRAWGDASESDTSELDHETVNLAMKWPKAFELAQRAGLKNIGDEDAYFEIRLERHAIA
ncbi:MAG: hypothetical protein V4772_27090 [Pseudomonadota bacterium]